MKFNVQQHELRKDAFLQKKNTKPTTWRNLIISQCIFLKRNHVPEAAMFFEKLLFGFPFSNAISLIRMTQNEIAGMS